MGTARRLAEEFDRLVEESDDDDGLGDLRLLWCKRIPQGPCCSGRDI